MLLQFVEFAHNQPGQREFNVYVNNSSQASLTDYDIYAQAGAEDKAVTATISASADANGDLALKFVAVIDGAYCSAITVIPSGGDDPSIVGPIGTLGPPRRNLLAGSQHDASTNPTILSLLTPPVSSATSGVVSDAGPLDSQSATTVQKPRPGRAVFHQTGFLRRTFPVAQSYIRRTQTWGKGSTLADFPVSGS